MTTLYSLIGCLLIVSYANGQNCMGREIGQLPTLFHGVSGRLFVESMTTFCIQNFTYDGLGPDAFLYFYYPGDPIDDTGGGVIIPLDPPAVAGRPQFEVGRAYTGELLRFNLPMRQYRACDFYGFGIWCRYASQLFTNITWNSDIFSAGGTEQTIQCTPSPGRGFVGRLPTLAHGVGGDLYIRDNKTFAIRSFTYDGQGPDAFVYWYPPGAFPDPAGNGFTIPLTTNNGPEGRFDSTSYTGGSDFVITIPDNVDVFACDVGNFTIWCRQAEQFFTVAPVDLELFTNNPLERDYEPNRILCDRPTTQPGILIGELPTMNPRAISGTFYVRDRWTFFIQLFSFDAQRSNVFLYFYPPGVPVDDNGGGRTIRISAQIDRFAEGRQNSFYNQDFTVDLRLAEGGPVQACDIGYFSLYASSDSEHLTKILIPQNIFTTDMNDDTKIYCPGSGAPPLFSMMSYLAALLSALLVYSFSF